MLLQFLVVSAVTMVTIVTSNFCPSWAPFYSDHSYALVGHVIQTLPLLKPACMLACQETLTCFSINIYKNHSGVSMCDLNRSNKKQTPSSLVRRTAYEYAEPQSIRYCVEGDCPLKDALPGNKFRFNSSIFEFFADRKNWSDARQHCQGLGGDLASFSSQTELTFIFVTVLRTFILTAIKMLYMDGSDIGLSLFNRAKLEVKDNKPSLALSKDTGDYATIPSLDYYATDLTFAFWFNLFNDHDKCYVLNNEGSNGKSVEFYIEKNQKVRATLEYVSGSDRTGSDGPSFSLNTWYHIAFTWNRGLRQFRWYVNGIFNNEETSEADANLNPTAEPNVVIGKRPSSSSACSGWIGEWALLSQALSQDEISLLKDGKASEGAWIGLNDITNENQIKWSDGTPLTYQPKPDLSNTAEKDCGSVKGNSANQMWLMSSCMKKLPHICEFPAV